MNYSPLRYPGGKNRLSAFVASVCLQNNITDHYIEPFAGGSSVGLFLLFENIVDQITINDLDRSIYAFWHSVKHNSEDLCRRIENAPLTVEYWDTQKVIQKNKSSASLIDLGFSTFYLNRTNRSGILSGGIIGGRNQEGKYKIGCRFNKEELICRIQSIAKISDRIHLSNQNTINLIGEYADSDLSNTLIYLDPPYYDKGSSLYLNHFEWIDHVQLARELLEINGAKWIVSYDDNDTIEGLYSRYRSSTYTLPHTAHTVKRGGEFICFSDGLELPVDGNIDPTKFKFRKNKKSNSILHHTYPGVSNRLFSISI